MCVTVISVVSFQAEQSQKSKETGQSPLAAVIVIVDDGVAEVRNDRVGLLSLKP